MSTLKSSAENLTLNADGSGNDIKFQSNGVEKASIDQDGSIFAGSKVRLIDDTASKVEFGDSGNASIGKIEYTHSGDYLYFKVNDAERLRITSGGDLDVKTGDIVFNTAGKGICLGVTTNTDANTLDDYEEGTWTPTYTPESGSFTTLTLVGATPGRYIKVGKKVTCFWYLGTSATNLSGASGDLFISGLPFACETLGAGNWSTGIYSTKWGDDQPTIASIHSSESFIRLLYRASHNADLSAQQTTDMGTGGDSNYTRGWVTYNTA